MDKKHNPLEFHYFQETKGIKAVFWMDWAVGTLHLLALGGLFAGWCLQSFNRTYLIIFTYALMILVLVTVPRLALFDKFQKKGYTAGHAKLMWVS